MKTDCTIWLKNDIIETGMRGTGAAERRLVPEMLGGRPRKKKEENT